MFFDIRYLKSQIDLRKFKNKKIEAINLLNKKKYKSNLHDFSFLFQDDSKLKKKILECNNLFLDQEKIILLGTGGSSLGSKAMLQAASNNKIIFIENIDPHYVIQKIKQAKKKKILLLVISKSGETTEVLSLFSILQDNNYRVFKPKNNMLIISDNKNSSLQRISKVLSIKFVEHNSKIGGRFSCFSETGLIPIKLAGLNSAFIKNLSDKVFDECINNKYSFFENVSVLSEIIQGKKYKCHVVISYQETLKSLVLWYRQLWGESLGKKGRGVHFLPAIGSVDQHSQLQMWLDGPDNIFYTIIIPKKRKQDLKLNDSNKLLPSYLKKNSLGNILFNMGIATYKELVRAKKPVRLIYLDDDSLYPAVKLMAFLMLEVPVIGKLLRINPFDQPAVEKVKVLTKKLLSKNGKN